MDIPANETGYLIKDDMNSEHASSRDGRLNMEESLVQETRELDEEVDDSNSNINATTESVSPSSLPEGENFKELTADDVVGRQFPTVEDAERWYRMYGTAIGFGARKQRVTRGIGGRVTRRRMVCCKEGKRDAKWLEKEDRIRNPRNETRENCLAACCFHYNKDSGTYFITEFNTEHSHELAKPKETQFIRSNRCVSNADLAHVNAMRSCSISTSRAYDYIVKNSGGFEFVGYTSKDLLNKMDADRRAKLIDGDAQAAIAYMNAKAIEDPGFMCKFSVDVDGRLANLFWRDSTSLYDFACFGDILIFDSTYKTNVYNRPLAVFVGTNNHRATIVFACAILVDETVETYTWVLKTFLEAMNGKKPTAVLTDGDKAMRKAIVEVFPQAKHRICSWHVGKNMAEKIKDEDCRKEFKECMYNSWSTVEWEEAWRNMVQKIEEAEASEGVENWLQMMYQERERWAEAFFTGHFFAGMTSTQRCEGMNKNLKFGIGRYSKMFEILPRIGRTVSRMRNDVIKDDYDCRNSKPVLTTHMQALEDKLGKKLTHDMYLVARIQIKREKNYFVTNMISFDGSTMFYVMKYKQPRLVWNVEVRMGQGDPHYLCSCMLFESDGIPCSHIFCVMKYKQIEVLPDSLIHERWTMSARDKHKDASPLNEGPDKTMQIGRCAALHSICNSISYDGSLTGEGFRVIMNELTRVKLMAEKYRVQHSETSLHISSQNHENVVRDPEIHTSKKTKHGEENHNAEEEPTRVERHCSYCKGGGHNSRTCDKKAADLVAEKATAAQALSQSSTVGRTYDFMF